MRGLLRRIDPVARAVDRARRKLRDAAGAERHTTTLADGRQIVTLDTGGDLPVLVALHGIGASKDHWARLAALLRDRVRVVAPDLPGFGESDGTGDLSMAGQAETVIAFLDAIGLGRVHLAGSSMGGRIAAELAHRAPERLRSLWLLAPAGADGDRPSEMIEGLFAGEGVPLFARTPDEYAASVAFSMRRPPPIPRPALRVLAAESAAAYDRTVGVFCDMSLEMGLGLTTEELVAGLPVPLLVTWGDEDRVLHPSGATTLAAGVADATVHRLAGIGHLPMMEAPRQTAAAFAAFLDAHPDA
ncbi:alpha/beta fold hydrolase [Rubrivirga sp. IMCC43871]|uniref:alpha/beta fold hydrolase n=1 Tax=Rubrivirga sp. IMCC43871 TaxID=3391575 RepID=UPI00398FA3C7